MIPPSVTEPTYVSDGWAVHEVPVTASTNLAAANLPVWEAMRADRQTAGRGRFQRGWVSDEGGLWLSAVVPAGADAAALPLAAGLAVCDSLRSLGLKRLRMRWPNDILVDDRKLAGLLVDRFHPGAAVAGIGINVLNNPECCDPDLINHTVRLADLVQCAPPLRKLTQIVLRHLRSVLEDMQPNGFAAILPRVNKLWGNPRRVELDLDGELRQGTFGGIGTAGELILLSDTGEKTSHQACQVRHLKELE